MNKKDHEKDKCNYRPISLLSVSGKIMESAVASSIISHISDNSLSNPHQWAYKKDHCTELLLSKTTEDWKRALDNNMVVGIVFVDQLLILFLIMCCFKSCKLIVITSPLLLAVVFARVKLRLVSPKDLCSVSSYFLSSVMICQTLSVTVMVNCICMLTDTNMYLARVALWTSSVLISPNSVKILSSLNRPSAT